MKKILPHTFSLFWIISSLFLTLFSIHLESKSELLEDGGLTYILFNLLYIAMCVIFFKFITKKTEQKLTIFPFIVGITIVLFGWPLFENDQYRYLWEGKVLLFGENPYTTPPNSKLLDHIIFDGKEYVGYPYLTTIYPPLGILFFSLGGFFNYFWGLKTLMLLNGILSYFFYKLLFKRKAYSLLLTLSIPLIQKEFIQSVHIDLFASFFMLLGVLHYQDKLKSFGRFSLLYTLSYWSKLLSLLSLHLMIIHRGLGELKKPKIILLVALVIISLPLFFYIFIGDLSPLTGAKAFTKSWTWNPGFYFILKTPLGMGKQNARYLSGAFFVLYAGFVTLRFYLPAKKESNSQNLYEAILFTYTGLIFFAPVYNAWYSIWFLPFAILRGSFFGVMYSLLGCMGYMAYGHGEYVRIAQVLTHIWFPLMWLECLWGKLTIRRAKSLILQLSKN